MTAAQAKNLKGVEITDEFPLERCIASFPSGLATSCVDDDCNQYLPLIVGRVWELDNSGCEDCDEDETVEIKVADEVVEVDGQPTRVFIESETIDEVSTEFTRNFLNQCPNTQDVYYWGEEVCVPEGSDAAEDPPFEYSADCPDGMEPGGGAWLAGEDDAEPGILFPGGVFLIGARYFQELADNALDWAENAEIALSVDNPANGVFEDCVLVLDRNALEDPKGKEADEKVYCPSIGIVRDEELELTSCTDPGMMACQQ
jgi:hypothetical protein